MPGRFALLIGSYTFQDKLLQGLAAPASDIRLLSKVLANPRIGDFETSVLVNAPSYKAAQAIEQFFSGREREDTLLVYFSGHGIKDDVGRLHFAAPDTLCSLLRTTSIPASLINDSMLHSRARRQLLFLDCCYGGAFPKGLVAKSGAHKVAIGEQFPSRLGHFRGGGRVILTSSDAVQYSFEGKARSDQEPTSIFTRYLIEGLETGKADQDGDGLVGVDELFEFVQEKVITENPAQIPVKWSFEVQDKIVVATSILGELPAKLPPDLEIAIQSPFVQVRIGAIRELRTIVQGRDSRLAETAYLALESLRDDDSRSVASEAQKILSGARRPTLGNGYGQQVGLNDSGLDSSTGLKAPQEKPSRDQNVLNAIQSVRQTLKLGLMSQSRRVLHRYRNWESRHMRLAITVEMGILWAVALAIETRANWMLTAFLYHRGFVRGMALDVISAIVHGFAFGVFVSLTFIRTGLKIKGMHLLLISVAWAVGFAIQTLLFNPIMGVSGFLEGFQSWLGDLSDWLGDALNMIDFGLNASLAIFNLIETTVGVTALVFVLRKRSVDVKLAAAILICFWAGISFASIPSDILNSAIEQSWIARHSNSSSESSRGPASQSQSVSQNDNLTNATPQSQSEPNGNSVTMTSSQPVTVEVTIAHPSYPFHGLVDGLTPFLEIFLPFWLLMKRLTILKMAQDQKAEPAVT